MAQSGSAPGLGPGGPRFESLYSDQRPRHPVAVSKRGLLANHRATVHWIYRKAHLRRLEKSQRQELYCLNRKIVGRGNHPVRGSCGESSQTLYKSRLSSYSGTPKNFSILVNRRTGHEEQGYREFKRHRRPL